MKKRTVGHRGTPLLDSIDLMILEKLEGASLDIKKGIGVLQLGESLGIPHNNLKPHLEKLLNAELILAWTYPNNKNKITLTTTSHLNDMDGATEKVLTYEGTLRTLRKINSHKSKEDTVKKLFSYAKEKK